MNEQIRRLGHVLTDYGVSVLAGALILFFNRLRRRLRKGVAVVSNLEVQKVTTKENEMLEGKEVDVALGNIGHLTVDVTDKLEVEIGVSAKVDLLAELHKLAAKTGTQLDDAFLATIDKLVGRA